MVNVYDFKKIEKYVYEIPASYREDMGVPARFYADAELLEGVKNDRSLEQLVNTATLPGAVKYALAMPDIHQGYGFPIGGVVATQLPDGVISPGGVGYGHGNAHGAATSGASRMCAPASIRVSPDVPARRCVFTRVTKYRVSSTVCDPPVV